MASIYEVSTNIYRINTEVAKDPVTYSFFLIKDDQPTLIETGFNKMFEDSLEAVKRLINPQLLRYIIIPHFEGDECGALNRFLEVAPNAVPVCTPLAAGTSISDFAIRPPLSVDEKSVLDLGNHRLRFLMTPYVHTWESMLAFDDSTGTLFSSDVFIQPGPGPAITDADLTEDMIAAYRMVGIFPSRAHLNAALDKIETLQPSTLACHHGSVKSGQIASYIRALRDHDVTGLTTWNPMQQD